MDNLPATIQEYLRLLDAYEALRERAAKIAARIELRDSCSVDDLDGPTIYYSYYYRSNNYGGSFPAVWLFVEDWESLWRQREADRQAEKDRKAAADAEQARANCERRERQEYERLKAKFEESAETAL